MKIFLFSHDTTYAAAAMEAGVDGIIVDWEFRDKDRRQAGYNTEINEGDCEHLRAMRTATNGHLICRINNTHDLRRSEALMAAELGANEILLPMVRHIEEVQECLDTVPETCRVSILAETVESLDMASALSRLPLARVYAGLNDLFIQRQSPHLFSPLTDGTLEKFRSQFPGSFSAAGVTLPECGSPVPCELIMGELARLGCDYTVARRSFRRDIPLTKLAGGVRAIRSKWNELLARSPSQIAADRQRFVRSIDQLTDNPRELPCA